MFTVEDNIFQTLGYSSVNPKQNKKSVSDFHICKAMKQKSLYKVNGCPDGSEISI